jgi:hypothetical protein
MVDQWEDMIDGALGGIYALTANADLVLLAGNVRVRYEAPTLETFDGRQAAQDHQIRCRTAGLPSFKNGDVVQLIVRTVPLTFKVREVRFLNEAREVIVTLNV